VAAVRVELVAVVLLSDLTPAHTLVVTVALA